MKKTDVKQPVAMANAFANSVYATISTEDFEIPAVTSTSADDSCTLDNGFLPITSIALDDGGKAPERKNFNGMFYLSTDLRNYLQNGGLITFSDYVSEAIGGYPQDAVLANIVDGQLQYVISLIDDNTYNFVANPEYIDDVHWKSVSLGGGSGLEIGDIGIAALGIDESKGLRRYLNGSIMGINANTQAFINKLKSAALFYPSLVCTEEEWQAISTLSVGGQCGKFVLDENRGTVRLPKIIMPIQGLSDLSKLGEIVEAGLPNIEARAAFSIEIDSNPNFITSATGAFSKPVSSVGNYRTFIGNIASGTNYRALEFNASLSNPTYGNSTTVQQEQIQYPYFIQIATGVEYEVNITNKIELNNPYSLGDSKYSSLELNNVSWLKSAGQWNLKSVYPSMYDWILENYNQSKDDFKLSTEEYDDYCFVINQENETFRLPTKNKQRVLVKEINKDGIICQIYSDGWCVQEGSIGQTTTSGYPKYTITLLKTYRDNNFNAQVTGRYTGNTADGTNYCYERSANSISIVSVGYGSDWKTEGYLADEEFESDLNLYFYVGETVENANLINAGEIQEQIADIKADIKEMPRIIKIYQNGFSGYVIYSNGYCEQWGWATTSGTWSTIRLLKTYSSTNYNITFSIGVPATFNADICLMINNHALNANSFQLKSYNNSPSAYWRTCGFLDQGEY